MPSDTVQIATAVISLIGTAIAGIITYLMARLRSDEQARSEAQKLHTDNVTVKVDEIQEALARIEANRANLAQLRDTLEDHGTELVAHAHKTAEELTAADPADLRSVLEHYGRAIVNTTNATIAKMAAIDTTETGKKKPKS